uniref:Uncharacterized protein n=1 Tax=Manihot esculenta TaxID=3983 RepID=A0A2C9VUX9_MANES
MNSGLYLLILIELRNYGLLNASQILPLTEKSMFLGQDIENQLLNNDSEKMKNLKRKCRLKE